MNLTTKHVTWTISMIFAATLAGCVLDEDEGEAGTVDQELMSTEVNCWAKLEACEWNADVEYSKCVATMRRLLVGSTYICASTRDDRKDACWDRHAGEALACEAR